MDILLTPLNAFANHVDLAHVLILNLIGWMCKGGMGHHRQLKRWTDIIPVPLGLVGIILAYVAPNAGVYHPIIQGLANAGLAWLLHQGVKRTQEQVQEYKTEKIKTLKSQRHKGTGDGTKEA
jgi:hypothetical protein